MPKAKFDISYVKKSQVKGSPIKGAAAKAADVVNLQIQDNEDATFTTFGLTAAVPPAQVDISALATEVLASSLPANLTVDPPTGMTSKMHGLLKTTPGTPAVVSTTVTWNDGSKGPFGYDLPVDVIQDPNSVTGVIIVPGTPTVRP